MSKKLVALVLAFALVFTSFTTAFAGEALPVDAQAAVTIGMLQGDSSAGVTNQYLATAPDRLQAAIMFLRLSGLEKTALAYTSDVTFADANTVKWAGGRNILAYLKNHPELGWLGKGGNIFDPSKAMEAKDYYKVMLEALGYKQSTTDVIGDFSYDQTVQFAASKGLTKVASVSNFTVADLATATIEALKATVKGTSETLAAKLVKANVINAAAAQAAGIYTPAPTTLAVESVKATNLKETVITFNKEVDKDSAEDASNYLLDNEDIAGKVALNADKKSVTITWTTALENQTEYDLTVSGILDAAGAELDEVTVTFLANDVTLPVAQSLQLVGPNTFKILFNEPIKTLGIVTVEDKDFDYEVANVTVKGNAATVELSDTSLENGSYNVTVTGFVDYADLKALKKTLVLAYAKDTTAPTATVTKATQTAVTVKFNKPVYSGSAADAKALTPEYFYQSYTSYKPALVYTTDFQTYTVYFTTAAAQSFVDSLATADQVGIDVAANIYRPLSEGNVKFVILSEDASDNAITDEWGNKVENNITTTLAITADTTAPTVTKVDVDTQNKIDVYFSENVTATVDNFTVVNKDGEEVKIASAVPHMDSDANEYYVSLNFTDALQGEYSLTVEDVVDRALEQNEIAKATVKFSVTDKTAPAMTTADVTVVGVDTNVEGKADYIYVSFPEDMATTGVYSVLNKDNYQLLVGTNYVDLAKDDKIATFNGNDAVKITIADSTTYNVASGDVTLVIGRVADALGNVTKGAAVNAPFVVKSEQPAEISSVKTIAEKTIEITINAELKAVNKSYILVAHGDNDAVPVYSIKSVTVADGKTVIVAILPATEKLAGSADTDITVSLADLKLETVLGSKVAANTLASGDVIDGFAPSVVKDGIVVSTADAATFTITFDEALNEDIDALYAQDLVIKDAKGSVLVAGTDYTTSATGSVLTVTITKTGAVKGDYKVNSASTIKYIRDTAEKGNKANAFTTVVTLEDLVK